MGKEVNRDVTVFVAGHRGLVGSAIVRHLLAHGFSSILTANREELDLRNQTAVDAWFFKNRPEYVIHAAGTVGGIHANASRPVDFLYDNLMMHSTVLRAASRMGVVKLLYLGSSCIYPRECPQPIKEEYLLSGPLEPTNAPYAVAKISGVIACEMYRRQYGCSFISAMPTNLYGPNDNFDTQNSHVLPALIRNFHEAKVAGRRDVRVWGTGRPRREFLHVDDLAAACLFLLENYDEPMQINIGSGEDVRISELADIVRHIVYPDARIQYDNSRPDGTPRKWLDVSRIHRLGWKHSIQLEEGIRMTYRWFIDNVDSAETRLVDHRFTA